MTDLLKRLIAPLAFFFLFPLLLPHSFAQLQPLTFDIQEDVPIWDFFGPYDLAWTGGIDNGQFSSIDFNLDGVMDLLIFDRNGNRIIPLVHDGTSGAASYRYAPEYLDVFPPLEGFVLCRDFDGDGDRDIFTFHQGGIAVYINAAEAFNQLVFFPYKNLELLPTDRGGSPPLYIETIDIDVPAIDDLDHDGDLDILVFDIAGLLVEYHMNLSQELYGHSDSLVFLLEEACWGHFQESAISGVMNLDVFCKGGTGGRENTGVRQHVGSTLLTFDADGDRDSEVLIGDTGFGGLTYLPNVGDSSHAFVDTQRVDFPDSRPVDISSFPAAYHVDVDNDNKRDLIVAPNAVGVSHNHRGVWWYRNTGTDAAPTFTYAEDNFLQEQMLDMGSGAFPVLVDYDQDSIVDLVVGNYGFYNEGNFRPQIAIFKNFGTHQTPRWELISDDLGDIAFSGRYQAFVPPTLGDLDADGDLDMIVGKLNGKLDFYRNTSSSPNSIFPNLSFQTADYEGIDVGSNATPQLVDIDGDNLLDLLIGERNGNLNYYRNTGNAQAPSFTLITENFGQIEVKLPGAPSGNSHPFLTEINGERYLFVGSESQGVLTYAPGNGPNWESAFPRVDTAAIGLNLGNRTAPTAADINGDSLPDLLIGNMAGGLNFLANTTQFSDSLPDDSTVHVAIPQQPSVVIAPNPTSGQLKLSLTGTSPIGWTATCYDLHGKVLQTRKLAEAETVWDLSKWPTGVYLLHLHHTSHPPFYRRVILQK